MRKFHAFIASLSVALLLAAYLAGCSDHGTPPPGTPTGGDFVLRSADGPVDTRALRGKVLLIYFGYTHCPDVCPASLAAAAQALHTLSVLAPTRAETVCLELLGEARMVTSEAHEETRALAAEVLGTVASTAEAMAALDMASTARWKNSERVRISATHAKERAVIRLSQHPGPPLEEKIS